jgi:hypothetical protein
MLLMMTLYIQLITNFNRLMFYRCICFNMKSDLSGMCSLSLSEICATEAAGRLQLDEEAGKAKQRGEED